MRYEGVLQERIAQVREEIEKLETELKRLELAEKLEAQVPAEFRWCRNRVYETGKILHEN